MSTLTKINCPKCGTELEAEESSLADGILCQACGHDFAVRKPEKKTPQFKIAAPSPGTSRQMLKPIKKSTREKAEGFEIFSLRSAFGGIVLLILGFLLSAAEGSIGAIMLSLGGSLLALAGWLYLVAQIIHIRANTEK